MNRQCEPCCDCIKSAEKECGGEVRHYDISNGAAYCCGYIAKWNKEKVEEWKAQKKAEGLA